MMAKPALTVTFDDNGQVLKVIDLSTKEDLDHGPKSKDYHPEEKKRFIRGKSADKKDPGAVLATENWCQWRKINGRWK